MKKSLERYFGTKAFYKMLLAVAIPIMVQQGFTNFVSMLDNIMVGRVGTEQMSGVAIVNQIIFVYNLCLFGGLSGVGIFTAQFFGKGDKEGIRNAFRFKLMLGFGLTALAIAALSIFSEPLIIQFLHDTGDGGSLEATLAYGRQYMSVMLLGLPAFMMVQVYSSTLRECGETIIPMKSGIAAVLVNLVFNYLLIYGKLGFPQLGVTGAAIATVMSRYVEAAIVMVWTHRHKFVVGVYRSMKVPKQLAKRIIRTGFPLLLNETLWSAGVAILTQCYSTRGLNAVAAYNISNTLTTLFNVVFIAMGNSVGIIVGRLLGCGRMDEAVETNRKIIFFDVLLASGIALVLASFSSVFPLAFNTNEQARMVARNLILTASLFMPFSAFKNASYFTLRSGGRTLITFLFDGGFIWVVSVPIAFLLSRFTSASVVVIFACVQLGDILKCILGYVLIKKRIWLRTIVSD